MFKRFKGLTLLVFLILLIAGCDNQTSRSNDFQKKFQEFWNINNDDNVINFMPDYKYYHAIGNYSDRSQIIKDSLQTIKNPKG
jgi:hypothetical protein